MKGYVDMFVNYVGTKGGIVFLIAIYSLLSG